MHKKNKSIYIQTYGCQMNVADSNRMAGLLEESGFSIAENEDNADVILLNTCSVRGHAEQKVWSKLGELRKIRARNIKSRNKKLVVGVVGCMAQNYGKKIFNKAPNVDFVCGTYRFSRISEILQEAFKKDKVMDIECSDYFDGNIIRKRKESLFAFVPISRGCNNSCTYCVVPNVRGPERNRPLEEIITEITNLAERGCREVTLLGQNVNSYRAKEERCYGFVDLLKKVSEVEGIERVRFITSHPKDASVELFEAIKELHKVCENLHLPVQSGSDNILKKMNRGYTRSHYLNLVKKVKNIVPGISLSTDIIVGFPGETEEDFQDTCNLIKEVEFDSAFVFKYSPRPNTPAFLLKDDVPTNLKKERNNTLLKLHDEISLKKNKALVGKTEQILVESESKNNKQKMMGRDRANKIVVFDGEKDLIGQLVSITIVDASPHTLYGVKI